MSVGSSAITPTACRFSAQERENEIRIAYLGGQLASGAYPRLAAAFTEDSGPIDLEAVFEWMLDRALNSFAP